MAQLYKRWLTTVSLIALLLIVLIVTFNLVTDPYDCCRILSIKRFNKEKTRMMSRGGRVAKSAAVSSNNYDTIVLGSSRSLVGIDPDSDAFLGREAYNASVSGTNMYELYLICDYILKQRHVREILLEVSFFTFTTKITTRADFEYSLFNQAMIRPAFFLRYLVSGSTFVDSALTVIDNIRGANPRYTNRGFDARGHRTIDYRKQFTTVLRNFLVNDDTYAGFSYGRDRLDLLRDLVARCQTAGVRLTLFIPPVHAKQLEALWVLDLFELFEEWKKDMAAIAGERDCPENLVCLYDFSGYNAYTTEPIPDAKSEVAMKWYWESSHFKKSLGEVIARIMLERRGDTDGLGVLLTRDNVEQHLAHIRRQREEYKGRHPNEVQDVEQLCRQTENQRMRRIPSLR